MPRERIGVLLVEDNPTDVLLLREALADVQEIDFALTQVERLADGQARLRSGSYDVVLLDLDLPDSSGPETFSRLHAVNPQVPMLVLTGLDDESVGIHAMQNGAQDYLLKHQLQAPLLSRSIRYAIERQRAALLLSESETRFFRIVDSAPDGIISVDGQQRITLINPAAERIFGYTAAELLGQPLERLLPIRFRRAHAGQIVRFGETGVSARGLGEPGTVFGLRKNGEEFPMEATISRLDVAGDRLFTVMLRDVTERRRAEELLQSTRDQLEAVFRASPVPIVAINPAGEVLLWSAAAERLFGWKADEVLGQPLPIIPADAEAEYNELRRSSLLGEAFSGVVVSRMARDRRRLELSISTAPLHNSAGERIGVVAIYVDLTEQLALRRALQASEERFAKAFQASPTGNILVRFADRRVIEVNLAYLRLCGYRAEEIIGLPFDAVPLSPSQGGWEEMWRRIVDDGGFAEADYTYWRRDGTVGYALVSAERLEIDGEEYALAVVQDMTERRVSEQALRESEGRFRQLAESIQEVFWLTDPAKRQMIYISPGYEQIWGRSCESLYHSPMDWADSIHPEDRERIREAARTKQALGTYDEEYRIVRPDGVIRWVRDQAFPVRDERGEIIRMAGVAEDITARRLLENQLRQTQKMESIGLLAGGVAHDFNNFLTVISGCTELLIGMPSGDPESEEILTEIRRASERAASLTRQLLAFSRQELLEPRVLDLNAIIHDIEKMLGRLLGEDILLVTSLQAGLGRVKVDPGQWTQVLMNLAVNARDAMPKGGRLTIETRSVVLDESFQLLHPTVVPGPYVMLTMSDTGVGMTAEIRNRVFEPFFTTKGLGRGTGLGLAVVHGIVTQSGGHITVYSEPAVGTTFRIYLPIVGEMATGLEAPVPPETLDGDETILVVEDEESIRRFAVRALSRRGYQVLQAGDGEAAMELIRQHAGPVHLLLTDVVMPKMDGRQLAHELAQRFPSVRVLYTSGYTDDAIVRHGILQAEVSFLSKPYVPLTLLRRVREVLDRD